MRKYMLTTRKKIVAYEVGCHHEVKIEVDSYFEDNIK